MTTTTTSESTTTTTTDAVPPRTPEERLAAADALLRRNVLWAVGAGILPLPLFDLLAATAVQIKMLRELSHLYGVTFREELAKKLVASLATGVVGMSLGIGLAVSLSKLIPGVGSALGMVTAPVTIGALTYATGKVFVMHFETGGTLLDFDPVAMRTHFKTEFEAAKIFVTKIVEDEKTKAPSV